VYRPHAAACARPRIGTPLLTLLALLASSLAVVTAPRAEAAETLLSQGRPATASSQESTGHAASAAVDGDLTGTRWASE
jgi:hypothetical protein